MTHMNRLYNIFLYSHIRNPHVGWVERFLQNPSIKNKRMETTHYLINRLYIDGFRSSTHLTLLFPSPNPLPLERALGWR